MKNYTREQYGLIFVFLLLIFFFFLRPTRDEVDHKGFPFAAHLSTSRVPLYYRLYGLSVHFCSVKTYHIFVLELVRVKKYNAKDYIVSLLCCWFVVLHSFFSLNWCAFPNRCFLWRKKVSVLSDVFPLAHNKLILFYYDIYFCKLSKYFAAVLKTRIGYDLGGKSQKK